MSCIVVEGAILLCWHKFAGLQAPTFFQQFKRIPVVAKSGATVLTFVNMLIN